MSYWSPSVQKYRGPNWSLAIGLVLLIVPGGCIGLLVMCAIAHRRRKGALWLCLRQLLDAMNRAVSYPFKRRAGAGTGFVTRVLSFPNQHRLLTFPLEGEAP